MKTPLFILYLLIVSNTCFAGFENGRVEVGTLGKDKNGTSATDIWEVTCPKTSLTQYSLIARVAKQILLIDRYTYYSKDPFITIQVIKGSRKSFVKNERPFPHYSETVGVYTNTYLGSFIVKIHKQGYIGDSVVAKKQHVYYLYLGCADTNWNNANWSVSAWWPTTKLIQNQ